MISWAKSTEIFTPQDNSEYPFVLFGNSATGQFGYVDGQPPAFTARPFAWREFQSVDLKPFGVAWDANFADLGGINIITGAASLYLAFRAPGCTTVVSSWNWYEQQLLSPFSTGGERSVTFDRIPLINGCFEYAANGKNYPDNGQDLTIAGPNYVGWNLKLKGWGR